MYSEPSPPWIVSLRGRCFEEMTWSCGANAAMVTSGSPAMYVPGTASSRPCQPGHAHEAQPVKHQPVTASPIALSYR